MTVSVSGAKRGVGEGIALRFNTYCTHSPCRMLLLRTLHALFVLPVSQPLGGGVLSNEKHYLQVLCFEESGY